MTQTGRLTMVEIGAIYGVSPASLRVYEEQGLLFPSLEDGTRYYTAKDRVMLELALKGKRLGFGVVELKLLLAQTVERRAMDDVPTPNVPPAGRTSPAIAVEIRRAERKLDDLRAHIAELRALLAKQG